jgi:hypothetical protein
MAAGMTASTMAVVSGLTELAQEEHLSNSDNLEGSLRPVSVVEIMACTGHPLYVHHWLLLSLLCSDRPALNGRDPGALGER